MQPPIPLGTVLQNRYRLTKILGQGGFGRTYLAEDQGRFNELCALKELIPPQIGENALEKSKELFQREATILYQIQHPQVPQFRATFEQDQRLFLVQDYVEGKTYRQLLDERKANNQTFSEAEVLQLLRQLLPVLAHLHSRGIIHRDIAPDNIIRRESDQLPVLIDFGVVKELATRFQSPDTVAQRTTVGKFGYAPSEQMQSGRAYPSSDLYSLAVTVVVLLTGREPQSLFDDNQLSWTWQRWATVSPGFAQILNRMLSYKPGDRYQSVVEVVQALQALTNQPNPQLPSLNPQPPTLNPQVPTPKPQPPTPNISKVETLAVGHRPDPAQASTSRPNRQDPVIPAPANNSIWENPWALAAIGTCVALMAGIGSWAVVSSLRQQQPPEAQTFPSPLVTESPSPTPTASATPTPTPTLQKTEPVKYSQNLNLIPGERTSVNGSLNANTTASYSFSGAQGQQLGASLADEGVLLTVLGPNQRPIDNNAKRVTRYEGTLPFTGDYVIQLSNVQGVSEGDYKLNVRLDNPVEPTPTTTVTPTPTSEPTPIFDVEPLSVNPDSTPTPLSGQTRTEQIKRYVVNVQQGQGLSVNIQKGAVTLSIRYPNGQLVEDGSNVLSWQADVPSGGDYQIDVIPREPGETTEFTLEVSVRNAQQ